MSPNAILGPKIAKTYFVVISVIPCMVLFSLALASPGTAPGEQLLNERAPTIGGRWCAETRDTSIRGKLISWFGHPCSQTTPLVATFKTIGYRRFTAVIGILDGREGVGVVSVKLNGDVAWNSRIKASDAAFPIDIDLTGSETLSLEMDWDGVASGLAFGDPRLSRAPAPARESQGASTGGVLPAPENGPAQSASLAVDPTALKNLAAELRQKVDADVQLKSTIRDSRIALATFELIDVASPSVAKNVAEDLSTKMSDAGFKLVERPQLDKAIKELKLQSSSAIDPDTAKEIGKLTGCSFILVGSISDRGFFVVINARLINTATGETAVAAQQEMRKSSR